MCGPRVVIKKDKILWFKKFNGMLYHAFGWLAGHYFFAAYCGARFEVFVCLPSKNLPLLGHDEKGCKMDVDRRPGRKKQDGRRRPRKGLWRRR